MITQPGITNAPKLCPPPDQNAYIHTYTHTYIHTYMSNMNDIKYNIYIYMYVCVCIQTIYTYTIYIYIYVCIQTDIQAE